MSLYIKSKEIAESQLDDGYNRFYFPVMGLGNKSYEVLCHYVEKVLLKEE